MKPPRTTFKKRNPLEEAKPGVLWVDQVGDCRSYAILARNFFVENPTHEKLTKFREHLSQSR